MSVLLKNATWYDGEKLTSADIELRDANIKALYAPSTSCELTIDCSNHFLYPGLINAHDHLEMNLYPRLGSPPYKNYVEWSKEIYKPADTPVREIEGVRISDRLLWGGIKNLIAGATTVVHHNPWNSVLASDDFPVNVVRTAWAHSLAFEKKLRTTFPKDRSVPFVIHAAEGVDAFAASEINSLNEKGLLAGNTVLVHGIAISDHQRVLLASKGVAIIWCPASNHFMFDATINVKDFRNLRLMLGSDSTLTGSPTFLEEMQFAARTCDVTIEEIFTMVTSVPARVFTIPQPSIHAGSVANLFLSSARSSDYFENLAAIRHSDIQLVIVRGKINLVGDDIAVAGKVPEFETIVEGQRKKINVDVTALRERIMKKVPLSWLSKNQLWNLIE